MHSIPFPKTECTVSALLFRSMEIEELDELAGILSGKLDRSPSGKGMAPMQIGYYPLTREREKRTRPLFPIRHVSRSMRDRASEEGRASDFSTSRKPEATRERSKPRGKRRWRVVFFFLSPRNTRGGAKTASFARA